MDVWLIMGKEDFLDIHFDESLPGDVSLPFVRSSAGSQEAGGLTRRLAEPPRLRPAYKLFQGVLFLN